MEEDTLTIEQLKKMKPLPIGAYTVTISPHIHERLERHILILKKLVDRSVTKQSWLVNAIREKLEKDSINPRIPKANTISVKIEEALDKLIVQRVEYTKKFRFSYSKKQWVVDAVMDKLDRDEKEIEKKVYDMKRTPVLTDQQQIELLRNENAELKALLQTLIGEKTLKKT